jgi:MBOAT, membrane-bound O-acyltransferase family
VAASAGKIVSRHHERQAVVAFLLAVSVAYVVAAALYPVLHWRSLPAVVGKLLVVAAVLACPLLIPAERIVGRAFAALVCGDLFFRLTDLTRQARRSGATVATWQEYAWFLIPFPVLLVVYGAKERLGSMSNPTAIVALVRLAVGGAVFLAALGLTLAATHSAVLRGSFWLDHAVKVAIFVVAIESLAQALAGLERLAGFKTRPIVDGAILSRTPAEFWSRYNNRVHDWLYLNVFLPSGGMHAPVRGLIAVFLVSALFHELMFGIATSRLDGYQATFFLLQIPAVMLSRGLGRFSKTWGIAGQIIARGLTILWMGATSVFFFHGVDRVFPFIYASQPWLP